MNNQIDDPSEIDDSVVESYFDGAGGTTAASMSMMAHGHDLPLDAVIHRLAKENKIISDWLGTVDSSGSVLDVGCGAGAWVEILATRYAAVVGVERSQLMVDAARERLSNTKNAQIIKGDGRKDLPEGPFDLIFVGGLFMYLNDADALALLGALRERLSSKGAIILRESTVRTGVTLAKGDYQAVYRSVDSYQQLFQQAEVNCEEVRQNYGYNDVVVAEELVSFRRKWLPLLPKDSSMLGKLTWWSLRSIAPISFWALPRILKMIKVPWPRLQNHFFLLRQPVQ